MSLSLKRTKNKTNQKGFSLGGKISRAFKGRPKVRGFDPFSTSLPPCIESLLQWLHENTMTVEGVFRVSGVFATINDLRATIDKGKDIDFNRHTDPHTNAGVFKQWLMHLPDPLCTFELYSSFISAHSGANEDRERLWRLVQVVKLLPIGNQTLLKRVMELCFNLSKCREQTKMGPNNLAIVFGPTLLRSNNLGLEEMLSHSGITNEIFTLLITFYPDAFLRPDSLNQPVAVRGVVPSRPRKHDSFTVQLKAGATDLASRLMLAGTRQSAMLNTAEVASVVNDPRKWRSSTIREKKESGPEKEKELAEQMERVALLRERLAKRQVRQEARRKRGRRRSQKSTDSTRREGVRVGSMRIKTKTSSASSSLPTSGLRPSTGESGEGDGQEESGTLEEEQEKEEAKDLASTEEERVGEVSETRLQPPPSTSTTTPAQSASPISSTPPPYAVTFTASPESETPTATQARVPSRSPSPPKQRSPSPPTRRKSPSPPAPTDRASPEPTRATSPAAPQHTSPTISPRVSPTPVERAPSPRHSPAQSPLPSPHESPLASRDPSPVQPRATPVETVEPVQVDEDTPSTPPPTAVTPGGPTDDGSDSANVEPHVADTPTVTTTTIDSPPTPAATEVVSTAPEPQAESEPEIAPESKPEPTSTAVQETLVAEETSETPVAPEARVDGASTIAETKDVVEEAQENDAQVDKEEEENVEKEEENEVVVIVEKDVEKDNTNNDNDESDPVDVESSRDEPLVHIPSHVSTQDSRERISSISSESEYESDEEAERIEREELEEAERRIAELQSQVAAETAETLKATKVVLEAASEMEQQSPSVRRAKLSDKTRENVAQMEEKMRLWKESMTTVVTDVRALRKYMCDTPVGEFVASEFSATLMKPLRNCNAMTKIVEGTVDAELVTEVRGALRTVALASKSYSAQMVEAQTTGAEPPAPDELTQNLVKVIKALRKTEPKVEKNVELSREQIAELIMEGRHDVVRQLVARNSRSNSTYSDYLNDDDDDPESNPSLSSSSGLSSSSSTSSLVRTIKYTDGSMYVGDVVNDMWHGWGKFFMSDGNVYEGECANGSLCGVGTIVYANGDKYEGEFKENMRHGRGRYEATSGDMYFGSYIKDRRNGVGKYLSSDGSTYEGDFVDGRATGKGRHEFPSGDVYVGEFKDDLFEGVGTYNRSDGSVYTGEFKESHREGNGKLVMPNGDSYEGQFRSNRIEGVGCYVFKSAGAVYRGEFKNGVFDGRGVYEFDSGDKIEGEFRNGAPVNT